MEMKSANRSRDALMGVLAGLLLCSGVGVEAARAQSFARSEAWHTGIVGIGDGSGPQTDAAFGTAVAAGDFNCDGRADLAIGAPFESVDGAEAAGAVYVLLDTPLGLQTPAQRWSETQIGGGQRSEKHEFFGRALAVGDFNRDGCADLAVGVPQHVGDDGNGGAFHVLYGAAGLGLSNTGVTTISQETPGVPGDMEWATDYFGGALAAGDFDDDGFADLAVGAPLEGLGGWPEALAAEAVQVFYGTAHGIDVRGNQWIDQSSSLGGVEIAGDVGEWDKFGAALAAGDWNGDGVADLAIGVPGDFANRPGAVEIVFGRGGYGLHGAGNFLFTQNSPGVLDDNERLDQFGSDLGGGDFDGDGSADLLVGVWSEDDGKRIDTGAMHLFPGGHDGPRLEADTMLTQDSFGPVDESDQGDRFGGPFATGDLNGDGTLDLAVAAPGEDLFGFQDDGIVHLVLGVAGTGLDVGRSVVVHQAADGPEPLVHDGEEFGGALAIADFDGDGHGDLVVGVPGDVIDGHQGAGSVNVFYGFAVK